MAYLGENEIQKYCAKAVEIALKKIDEDDERYEDVFLDNDVWGYYAMKERIDGLVFAEGVDLEEEKKQRMIDNVLEACATMNQKMDGVIVEVKDIVNKMETEKRTNDLIKKKIESAYSTNLLELKDIASNSVDEIISRIKEACELFIESKMSNIKIGTVIKNITKKGKEELAEEYRNEYIEKYLEIKKNDYTWIDALMNDYKDSLTAVFNNEYAKVGLENCDIENDVNENVKIDMYFFDTIGENMSIVFEQQIKENLPEILSVILLYIPGYQIIDSILLIGSIVKKSQSKGESKLEKKTEQVKRRARLSVSFNRVKFFDRFRRIGQEYNKLYKEEMIKRLNLKNEKIDKVKEATDLIFEIQEDIDEYFRSCKTDFEIINGGF